MAERERKEKPSSALAVLRPVFRGLRQRLVADPFVGDEGHPCSAETRFQGIATGILRIDDGLDG